METGLEQARTLFLEGVAHYEAGRLPQAEQKFAAALSLAPGRPSVLTNLGVVRLKLGRTQEGLDLLQEALAREPDNAETLAHCATALAELGRTQEALAHFDRALAIDAQPAATWLLRGTALRELGRTDEAAASFRESLARGGDRELLQYYLAGLEGGAPPPRPPRQYVQALFDRYALEFDDHLVQSLRYDAPPVLAQGLAGQGRRWQHALDLGCGTGLCGPFLRKLAERVTGVDLSGYMLERAAGTRAYDALQQADALEFLLGTQDRFDLAMAADVFIYVGALDDLFRALANRMPDGGSFCFTVEESTGEDIALRPSLRYAHSERYLRQLAQESGFTVTAMERRPLREEERRPIPGLFAWLQRA
ncbi:MAG TPA: tetratricopeptide repeat protein [Ramlibacter sp.]|nr:tetratricopeptide repeat protein [Ramlibacter sp.]